MAHFAELDTNNIVTRVIVVSNDDLLDENGVEQESLGVAVCRAICGADTTWVQTSYNSNFRKQYAGIGMKYEASADLFFYPVGPFPSWVLNADYDWEPPIAEPSEGGPYSWNEETQTWDQVVIPAEEPAP